MESIELPEGLCGTVVNEVRDDLPYTPPSPILLSCARFAGSAIACTLASNFCTSAGVLAALAGGPLGVDDDGS